MQYYQNSQNDKSEQKDIICFLFCTKNQENLLDRRFLTVYLGGNLSFKTHPRFLINFISNFRLSA